MPASTSRRDNRDNNKTKPQYAVLYLRNIPIDLKRKFKSICAERGVTLTEGIVELIERKLQDESSEEHYGKKMKKAKKA